MTHIPLSRSLKKRKQRTMGEIQDVLMDFIVQHYPGSIFHGGTCLWRVYKGNRFSEDIDLYLYWKDDSETEAIKRDMSHFLRPYNILLKKFKATENTIFSKDKLISWTDFTRGEDIATFGMLPRVSPTGRYVLAGLKDRTVFLPRPDILFSQIFFPVMGILAYYDRETDNIYSLPGRLV